MSIEPRHTVLENTRVSFDLQSRFPVFREEYRAEGVGTVTLTGLFNQRAHLKLDTGERYQTLPARTSADYPNELLYAVVQVPGKDQVCVLHTPLRFASGSVPHLRFWTTLDGDQYVFRQITAGRRGFELWDGMGQTKLVNREASARLMPDLTVLYPVPALLVLLFPWMDSQTIIHHQR